MPHLDIHTSSVSPGPQSAFPPASARANTRAGGQRGGPVAARHRDDDRQRSEQPGGRGAGCAAFDAIGPVGVVAVRQWVAAVVLMPVARPPLRRLTWSQWWPVLLLAAVFGCMNLSVYVAIDRWVWPWRSRWSSSARSPSHWPDRARAATCSWRSPPPSASTCSSCRAGPATSWAWRSGRSAVPAGPRTSCSTASPARGCPDCRRRRSPARCRGGRPPSAADGARGRPRDGGATAVRDRGGVLASVVPYAVDLVALRFVPRSSSRSS